MITANTVLEQLDAQADGYGFQTVASKAAALIRHLQVQLDTSKKRKVQEYLRAKPENRNWETSYTKKVVDALVKCPKMTDISAAADLLRDYHDTQHTVYEARDEARKIAKEMLTATIFRLLKHVPRSAIVSLLKDFQAKKALDLKPNQYAKFVADAVTVAYHETQEAADKERVALENNERIRMENAMNAAYKQRVYLDESVAFWKRVVKRMGDQLDAVRQAVNMPPSVLRPEAVAVNENSVDALTASLKRAEAAHAVYEKQLGRRDEDWAKWCAEYMAKEGVVA